MIQYDVDEDDEDDDDDDDHIMMIIVMVMSINDDDHIMLVLFCAHIKKRSVVSGSVKDTPVYCLCSSLACS